jgi:DNA-binding beta-propeller fold protein YncE
MLGAKGKLYTEGTWNGLYVLDTEHNRILILNKKGELISTLESDQFKNMRDFVVDEKGKTIYVLSDSTLLKVNF